MQPETKINELEELKAAFSEDVIDPMVTILTEKEFAKKAQEIAVPANKWFGRIRHEIVDILGEKGLNQRIKRGLEAIIHDFYSHVQKTEVYTVLQEWKNGIRNIKNMIITFEATEKPDITQEEALRFFTLQELMGISDQTLNDFYETGRTYFLHNDFQNAADVFLVVTMLDFFRHNSWVALGLAEERLSNWEKALHSYSMAALTKDDAPIPHIHSAECYIAMGQYDDAKSCLELAQEAMQLHPSKADEKLTNYIQDLQRRKKGKIIDFAECQFKDEGEFNRWQWDPINYFALGERVNLEQMVNFARKYESRAGNVLSSLSKM